MEITNYFFWLGLVQLAIGSLLLFLGRKLFWLFIGTMGFYVGLQLGTIFFYNQSIWVQAILATALGAAGVIFLIFMQKVAIVYAGFLGGGYLLNSLWIILGFPSVPFIILLLVGGIIGGTLSFMLFDTVIIALTSLAGALFILESSEIVVSWQPILFVLLATVGIVVQMKQEDRQTVSKPAA